MVENLNNEIWVDIEKYPGYQVSNLGRIKSLRKWNKTFHNRGFWREGNLLKPTKDVCGYMTVGISRNGKKKIFKVHRLVMENFIGVHPTKKLVNHINSIREDNRLENLEWCTHAENMQHSYDKGGRVSWLKNVPHEKFPKCRRVLCENFGVVFPSAKSAAKAFGFRKDELCKAMKGIRQTQFGLSFRFI